ncbi:hypothetical protein IEO21_10418 [Rhodonia placenta]|uniref:Uncharacterized protein n=1 Tax=Rhodonia placenta TaxID=104341 RepID=A0A8H7TXB5_9APHY|nr:hypothetical protein IEO21_10418 [Postia placenta]
MDWPGSRRLVSELLCQDPPEGSLHYPNCEDQYLSRVGTASSRFLIFSFPRAQTRDPCTTCLIRTHRYLLYD